LSNLVLLSVMLFFSLQVLRKVEADQILDIEHFIEFEINSKSIIVIYLIKLKRWKWPFFTQQPCI